MTANNNSSNLISESLSVIVVDSPLLKSDDIDVIINATPQLLQPFGEISVRKCVVKDIAQLLEALDRSTPETEQIIKDAIFVSASMVGEFTSSEAGAADNNEQLEELLRTVRAQSVSILLFVEKHEEKLAARILETSETLGIDIEAVLVGTPPSLVSHRLRSFVEHAKNNAALLEQQTLVEETNNHLIREQEVAKAVFEKVTREHQIDLPNVNQWLSPIAVFNGDVFMASPTPDKGLLVLLGDFTGHGLGASLGAIPLAATFYRMASKGFTLRDICVEMNRRLNESLPTGFFCCALVAHINFEQETVEYINAGLPDCYWLKKSNGELKPMVSSALPFGIQKPDQFNIDTHRVKVSSGDRLFLLSDGLLETENQYGEAFGAHRLVKSVNGEYLGALHANKNADYLSAMRGAVKDFSSGQARFDDISFAEIEIIPAAQFANSLTRTVVEETQKPSSWSMTLSFGAQSIKNKDPIPQVLNLLLDEPGLKSHTGSIFTIVSELYNNALDHGVLKLDSSIKDGPSGFAAFYEQRGRALDRLVEGNISFDIQYEACAETGSLKIVVSDSGQGFDWHAHAKASLQTAVGAPAKHGRGLELLRELCDSLTFAKQGSVVKAVFSWDKNSSASPAGLNAA